MSAQPGFPELDAGDAPAAGAFINTGLPTLSAEQFDEIRELTYQVCGIHLPEGKEGLVQSRLTRRLRQLNLTGFDAYLVLLRSREGRAEMSNMIDALTTNKTSFFREPRHFEFLAEHVLPATLGAGRPLRIWSAGCSSGEEPYSLSMLTQGAARGRRSDVRILATDIASDILGDARSAVYEDRQIESVPEAFKREHLELVEKGPPARYRVREEVRASVRFARLNLMGQWPMRGPFDVIFCRNVMIYFDKKTQEHLVGRFEALLRPGGYLFVGHSESLSGIRHRLRFVQPAVYER
jgi:chemotaxis protein methyltransferase CheR